MILHKHILNRVVTAIMVLWLFGCSKTREEDGDYAHDVLFLGANHILVAGWSGPIFVSRDQGKSWKRSPNSVPLKVLSRGPGGRAWGIHGWRGIHEPSEGAICYSDDGGDTWNAVHLKGSHFFVPGAFVSAVGAEPVILAIDGQLWEHHPAPHESVDCWTRLGSTNPDKKGHSGVLTDKALYVTSDTHVWMSLDRGTTWTGQPLKNALLCQSGEYCWAAERPGDGNGGQAFRTTLGRMDWEKRATVAGFSNGPFCIAVDHDRVFASGEGAGWRATACMTDTSGIAHEVKGINGKQCYSVRIGPDGKAWFVADGLFRQEDDGECRRIWP